MNSGEEHIIPPAGRSGSHSGGPALLRLSLAALLLMLMMPIRGLGAPMVNVGGAFVENRGQWGGEARFMFELGGMRTWFTGRDLLFVLDGGGGTGHVLRQRFLGSGDDALTAVAPLDARWSFIRPGGTIAGVEGYGELRRDAIYPGIGARYYRRGESLKYDLIVAPGADPRLIRFRYDGADRTMIGDDGALHVGTSVGELLEAAPYCYQDIGGTRRSVPCRFVGDRRGIGFSVGRYDRSRPLVIDPSLVYSSYFGGRLADAGRGITLDTSGNIVVTGITISPDIPTTVGAYGRGLNPSGAQDIFVAKLDPTGSRLIYATYIGGGGDDEPASVRILPNGRVVVAGSTASPDFPVTPNQRGYHGKGDGFVLILDDFGGALALSTCVGGGEDDRIEGLAIGSGGDIYVAGRTRSADFPTSANYPTTRPSYNTTLRGTEDAFVARLTQSGVFYYSTYLGGDSNDVATAIAVEPGGAAWVTGWTYSDNFPTAGAPFSSVLRGKSDCFVTRFRFDGTTPEYSTLIGGDGDDLARSIALDADGSAYITGSTSSSDYPFSIANPVASASWFVTKFLFVRGPRTTTRDYSRRIGVQDNGSGWTIQAGANNEVFIAGSTDAADFPLTADAFTRSPRGGFDIAFVRLGSAGNLLHASVIGGAGNDIPWHESYLTRLGDLIVTGVTGSTNFPLARGAYDSVLNDSGRATATDAFIMSFSFLRRPVIYSPVRHLDTLGCSDERIITFYVYNTGESDLNITRNIFGTPSPFEVLEPDPNNPDSNYIQPPGGIPYFRIRPGDSLRYVVRFAPKSARDSVDTLQIYGNDSSAGHLPLRIAFNVSRASPAISAVPVGLTFKPLLFCQGFHRDSSLAIVNSGTGSVTVTGARPAGGNSIFNADVSGLPRRLARPGFLSLPVHFHPPTAGLFRDTLLVTIAECPDPLRVPLEAHADSILLAYADTLLRIPGLAPCDDSVDVSETIFNRGTAPAVIDSMALSGLSGVILTRLPDTLAVGSSVVVRLRIKAPAGLGPFTAELRLNANPCGIVLRLPIAGERLSKSALTASLGTLDFGIIAGCAGTVAHADSVIVIRNSGAATITILPPVISPSFTLSGGPGGELQLPPGDSLLLLAGYDPAAAEDVAGLLIIPSRSGVCLDTIRIPLHGGRRDQVIDPKLYLVDMPGLADCQSFRDTLITLFNRSPLPLKIERVINSAGALHLDTLGSGAAFTIPANGSVSAGIRFIPQDSGRNQDTLFYITAPCGDSIVVVLRGNKSGAVLSAVNDTIVFRPRLSCQAGVADTLVALIRNAGDDAGVTIGSARIISGAAFDTAGSVVGLPIPTNGILPIPISFLPGGIGIYRGMLEVVAEPCGDTFRIQLIGEVVPTTLAVAGGAFGVVPINESRSGSVRIANNGPALIHIDSIANISAPFRLLGSTPPLPADILPGDTLHLTIEFAPGVASLYAPTPSVVISVPCVFSTPFQLTGEGVLASDSVDICIDNTGRQGYVGDTVEIPVVASRALPLGAPTDIVYRVRYDWRRLQLLGVDPAAVIVEDATPASGVAHLRERNATALRAEPLRLRFRLLAGREVGGSVQLDSAGTTEGNPYLAVCSDSAIIRITDRCIITGVFGGKFSNMLEGARPNPAASSVEITYQQLEDARATLRVFDISGREVLRPLDEFLPGGRYTLRFDIGRLSSGSYYYSIKAGSYLASGTLVVGK